MFDVLTSVKQEEHYIKKMYTYFHLNPELGGKEEQTMKVVFNNLKDFGLEVEKRSNCGVIAWINRGKAGKKVALRADMDALPMTESPNNLIAARKVVSQVNGVMHACGHDAHTAMLLGAAKVLAAHAKEIAGEVVLLFEQGEENGFGANGVSHAIIEEAPDALWGIHVYSGLASGKISVDPGPRMAAGVFFDIDIKGKSGHGSRPDMSENPLDCFTDIYSNLNQMKMTTLNPFLATTLSVCKVNMGSASNIIPEKLNFAGSFRVTDLEESKKLVKRVIEILDYVCPLHHCTYKLNRELKPSGLYVYNHPGYAKLAQKAIKKVLGEQYIETTTPWMASESMAKHLKYAPGVFAFLGIANAAKGTGAAHHNVHFEVDEDVLLLGSAATVQYALDVMTSAVDNSNFHPNRYTPEELTQKPWLV